MRDFSTGELIVWAVCVFWLLCGLTVELLLRQSKSAPVDHTTDLDAELRLLIESEGRR